MVTFTCNNCGDSVKKNRVEKHYSIECRRKSGGPNVCCIDCLKDFRQDYEAHTSCQTEDERYSAKGTFVAKDPKNKQKNKQLSWSEIIQSIADSTELMQPSKDILNIIKESDNVPRKEAKFKNFCMNNAHLRRFMLNDIMDVFNLIQEEMKKNTEAVKLEKEKALAAAKQESSEIPAEVLPAAKKRSIENMEEDIPSKKVKVDETSGGVEEESSKQKKNEKSLSDVNMEVVQNGNDHSETNGHTKEENSSQTNGEVKKKKKKNKKKSLENSSSAIEMEVVTQDSNKKDYKSVATNGTGATKNESLTNGLTKSKKKKKNKKKSLENSSSAIGMEVVPEGRDKKVNGSVATNGHTESKKKKKNKRKSSESAITEEIKIKEEPSSVGEEDSSGATKSPQKKRKSVEPEKTPFKEIIAKLLKPGTEFKLKSLKKMVFAVYKSGEEEVPREVRENFNKKLLKIPNVEMNEKMVKLVK